MTSNSSAAIANGLVTMPSLRPHEVFWRDHHDWLRDKGYELRPRYKPERLPVPLPRLARAISRRGAAEDPNTDEDSIEATRLSDGRTVELRKVSRLDAHDITVQQYLATWPLASHPKNHTVPILDVLELPDEGERALILVTPSLEPFHAPAVRTVGEAIDFLEQVLEGLQFMHNCNIAHRNCAELHVLQDPAPVYPRTRRRQRGTSEGSGGTLRPVRYYLADGARAQQYGHGSRFRRAASQASVRTAAAAVGFDDPFAADVRALGVAIERVFLSDVRGMAFLSPLVEEMMRVDPATRPHIDDVIVKFREVKGRLHWWTLRARLMRKDERGLSRLRRDFVHVLRTFGYIIIRRPAIPSFA